MKKIGLVLAVVMMFVILASANAAEPTLKLNKTTYAPGEKITVTFTAPANYGANAWVGVIPSSVKHGSEATNDQNDVTYQYLKKRASGKLVFSAPDKTGNWDVRMNDSDSDGKEVAAASFTVEGAAKPSGPASLTLKKTTFKPGETITVAFSAPAGFPSNAWVGIIPSNIAHGKEGVNDEHDVTYQYLSNRAKGTLSFKAPGPGNWDLRMNDSDNNGKEAASVSFTVK